MNKKNNTKDAFFVGEGDILMGKSTICRTALITAENKEVF